MNRTLGIDSVEKATRTIIHWPLYLQDPLVRLLNLVVSVAVTAYVRPWRVVQDGTRATYYLPNAQTAQILPSRRCDVFIVMGTVRVSSSQTSSNNLLSNEGQRTIDYSSVPLQWRHNERDGVSNQKHHDLSLNRLLRRRSKKTSKLRVTGLCAGNSPVTVDSPHKGPVTRKMFPFYDVIMALCNGLASNRRLSVT